MVELLEYDRQLLNAGWLASICRDRPLLQDVTQAVSVGGGERRRRDRWAAASFSSPDRIPTVWHRAPRDREHRGARHPLLDHPRRGRRQPSAPTRSTRKLFKERDVVVVVPIRVGQTTSTIAGDPQPLRATRTFFFVSTRSKVPPPSAGQWCMPARRVPPDLMIAPQTAASGGRDQPGGRRDQTS